MSLIKHTLTLANERKDRPEVFYSLQGEGPETGRPSIFVRLSLCNLTCVWCDTPYTWNWDDKNLQHESEQRYRREDEQSLLSFDELTRLSLQHACSNFVITGGEPMVQFKRLEKWFAHVREARPGATFDIETNATIVPSDAFDAYITRYVCSPKLSNSKVAEEDRIVPKAMDYFAANERAVFKFVIGTEKDLEEVHALAESYGIKASRIFLMPLGTTDHETKLHHAWISELCLKHGYRFSPRLHLSLYGDGRGV